MKLGVNIDHVATVREVRSGIEPEPVFAALLCQSCGADSIVVHLREDRRHIKERDLYLLKEVVKAKLNLEMSVAEDIVEIACNVRPAQATLVPEKRQEITTEGGLDVSLHFKRIRLVADRLKKRGIEVSLFIDPDKKQIDAAKRAGVGMIELHTGRYASAGNKKEEKRAFEELKAAVRYARNKGLRVFAGHGLHYFNVARMKEIRGIEELNIGYAIVCRAVLVGLERAVKEMKALIG
jgi:pyridoxine 5-phosphate synthase